MEFVRSFAMSWPTPGSASPAMPISPPSSVQTENAIWFPSGDYVRLWARPRTDVAVGEVGGTNLQARDGRWIARVDVVDDGASVQDLGLPGRRVPPERAVDRARRLPVRADAVHLTGRLG